MQNGQNLALVAILSLCVAGCGAKATGQSVAVVNGEEITFGELNAELANANIPASADKKTIMPQLLQTIVDRRLMAQRAAEQGIDKTPDYIARQRRLNEDLLIGLSSKRQADSIKLPNQRAIDAFIAANPGMFANRTILNLDQLQFVAPTGAEQLSRLKNDHSLDQLAASLNAMGVTFVRMPAKLDTATVPAAVLQQIYALPAGEPFIVPIGGRMYASVITSRESANASPDENRRIAVEAIRRQTLGATMDRELRQLRSAAKIEYQDGYAPVAAGRAKAPAGGTKT